MEKNSPKILELGFVNQQLPKTLEILEITPDRFVLTEGSISDFTGDQIYWVSKTITLSPIDHAKLATLRAEILPTQPRIPLLNPDLPNIDTDPSSTDFSQSNSLVDTNTVISDINLKDDSTFDLEMPPLLEKGGGFDFTSIIPSLP